MSKVKKTPRPKKKGVLGRPPKYEWDEWFAKKQFALERGVDYHSALACMQRQVRDQAKARGVKVRFVNGVDGVFTVLVNQPLSKKTSRGKRTKPQPHNKNGPPFRYKWDEWFAAKRFVLERGVHYHVPNYAMGGQIRNAATKRGLRVSFAEEENGFTVLVRED